MKNREHRPEPPRSGTIIKQLEERTSALSVKELAEMMNVGPNSIYDVVKDGKLNAYRIGTTIRIDPKHAADWLRGSSTGFLLPQSNRANDFQES